ncbi:MAG: PHP domain-containing protein [Acidimicrobiaceae bacterium]|nr:PHP domain-containing protein [Acidimicrobiaceae bacterium]
MIDLHTHSNFSDGSDTPAQLAARAHDLGLRAISLTDHDTTASHDQMAEACARLDLELIAGVEISLLDSTFARHGVDGQSFARGVHVLAYFLPLQAEHPVQQLLARLRRDRTERNARLTQRLIELGFDRLTLENVSARAANAEGVGRPHFAAAMFDLHPEIVGERTAASWSQLFVDWLGSTGRAYVAKTTLSLEDFIATAKGSGTVFSIAHPLLNYLPEYSATSIEAVMPAILASLRERGVAGVEAYYGGTSAATRALMLKLTRNAGLIPTGGSDYHGLFKEDVSLGVGHSGDLRVPDEILDELKAAR